MSNADKFVHPTKFTGQWPNWNGYTWLDWVAGDKTYHPGDDYNFGSGNQDLGQDAVSIAKGIVFHASESNKGYGDLVIIKHTLGYILKRFIKETYGIDTDVLYSLYAHLQNIKVKEGDEVDAGSKIAEVGKTGTKSPHLHAEIYHLTKDLVNTAYRFYPIGWSKEKIKANWLPIYQFIEATKNLESYEQFLGKPRAYWEQVEKDREKLLKEAGEEDQEFLKIQTDLTKKLENCKISNEQKDNIIDNHDIKIEKADAAWEKKLENCQENVKNLKETIKIKESRITEILSEQSEKLKIGEAVTLLLETIKKAMKGKS